MHLHRTDPIQPTQQHRNGPRIVTKPVAGTFEQAELGAAVGIDQLTGVGHRHAVVLFAVHDEQRPRCKASRRRDRPETPELAGPLLHRRREVTMVDRTDVTGVFEEAARMFRPVVEVGTRTQKASRRHPRVVGSDTDRDRATGVGAEQDHPGR